jgi:hypothetical protein
MQPHGTALRTGFGKNFGKNPDICTRLVMKVNLDYT